MIQNDLIFFAVVFILALLEGNLKHLSVITAVIEVLLKSIKKLSYMT